MGIFTGSNRVTGTVEPLAEATGYRGTIGATKALIENVQNDRALFEAVIENDFQEVQFVKEGADIESLNEASLDGLGNKIKEFLKKAWEKIKALISSFINMIMTVIIRDNKKLVDKYRTEVIKKDLTKMKYKWSECKSGKDLVLDKKFWGPLDFKNELYESLTKWYEGNIKKEQVASNFAEVKSAKFKEDLYKQYGLKADELVKSLRETEFKDSETMTGMSDALLSNIMKELETSKDVIDAYKKALTDANSVYSTRTREVDAAIREASSADNKAIDAEYRVKKLNLKSAVISVEQEIVTNMISTVSTVYKGRIKECRAAFARAAAFNEKLVKESTELEDAMDDVQHGIIDDLFENEMFV